jgi:hypothetical protein
MTIGLQLIALMFGLLMLYLSFLAYKKKLLTFREEAFWIILWAGFLGISLFPASVNFVIENLHIARTMDLIMIGAFMVLSLVGFNNYINGKRDRKKIEELVRKIALEKLSKKKGK